MKATLITAIALLLLVIGYTFEFGGDIVLLVVGWIMVFSWWDDAAEELKAWTKEKKRKE